jgi:DNA-binding transcriptional MerR regulator
MRNLLNNLKGKKYLGVAELAKAATTVLSKSDSNQEKGTVTEYPDERTVRFYLSEGLIPAPNEKKGTSTVFGYEHLLALLTIKKLQTEHLPIRKIREIINGKTEKELEKILCVNDAADEKSKNQAQEYLESILLRPNFRAREVEAAPLYSLPSPTLSEESFDAKKSQSWKRFELAPGLELHVEENFEIPPDPKESRRLLQLIKQIIQSFERQ